MRAVIISLLCLLLSSQCHSQAVVPQSSPLTSCQGKEFIIFGNDDVQALPIKTATTSAASMYIHTTYFNVTQSGVSINQLSFGVLDNPSIASLVLLRLGLYQLTPGTPTSSLSLLAQSEEISLFSTTATIIYANIPTTVLRPGTYAIGFWANNIIYTGVGTAPTSPTSAYLAYTYNGLARSSLIQYSYGTRALAARGCVEAQDPFADSGNQLYGFCAWIPTRKPSAASGWTYTNTHEAYVMGGKLAVSRTQTGTGNNGQWNKIVAGYASLQMGTAGGYYYTPTVTLSGKRLVLGGPPVSNNNQLYSASTTKLDFAGMSFMTDAGDEQFIVGYTNNSYYVNIISAGSRDFLTGGALSGLTLTPISSVDQVVPCTPPSTFRSDVLSCPAGSVAVPFGDDDIGDNTGMYSTEGSEYNYGNIIHHRPFQVKVRNVEMRQVSFQMNANPMKVVRMRMAIFSYTGAYGAYPTFTLLAQTREVSLDNIAKQVVKVNLITPVNLAYGQNYTLAFITDIATWSPYGYFDAWPITYNLGYDGQVGNGFASSMTVSENLYTVPLGGYGCARQATTRQFSFCSSMIYAAGTRVYSGVLTVIAEPYDSENGQYYQVTEGFGTVSYILASGVVSTVNNFTVHDFNMFSNNRLYVNTASPIDKFGIQLVVQTTPNGAYAFQLLSFYDPLSAETEFRENQQSFSGPAVTGLRNMISTFTYQAHSGGAAPTCTPPARPANTVVPASVPRVVCPNQERAISDSYGNSDIADLAIHLDGTLIQGNKIYTQQFTAEGSGIVRQLAVGILRNIDRPDTILIRLGLYSAANNSLIVQTAQTSLFQAIDQLIVVNLPFTVSLVTGQTYYIALWASSSLEVATTATAASPSMTAAFSPTGLPVTFVNSGNDVSVSVAAFICVSTTHSFCGHYQYYVASTGSSVTLMYQGLLQADVTPRTNAYGTYRSILAVGGRLTSYVRGPDSPTQASSVLTFYQRLTASSNLYTQASNGKTLDNEGLQLAVSDGTYSSLVYNTSISAMDESWRGDDKETDLVYSGFEIVPLLNGQTPIPACSLQSVPHLTPPEVPLPTCPADQALVWYGDADNFDRAYNQEGYYLGESNHLYLRPFTTDIGKATLMSQVKFGININYNTVNRIRMGIYTKDFQFMAGTPELRMVNPHNVMFTGTLSEPQYLYPNTLYYLAMWTEHAIYSGFSSGDSPAMIVPFNGTWPQTFVNTVPNSQRAVGGVGCTTNQAPPTPTQPAPAASSSSSSSLSKGAVAGIVIGVVIATNLILLCLFWFCCVGPASAKAASSETNSEHSKI